MMLVNELPAALLVWVVGSAARVGCSAAVRAGGPCNPPFPLAECLFLAGRLKAWREAEAGFPPWALR